MFYRTPTAPYDSLSFNSLSMGSNGEQADDSHVNLLNHEVNDPNDTRYDNSVAQEWSSQTGQILFQVVSFLFQIAILAFAAMLIPKPIVFAENPFPFSVSIYNSIVTAFGSLFKTLALVSWTNLGAGYLVKRLCERKMTYQLYDRSLHLAMGSIHWQASRSFVISLLLFTSFNIYAAAFNAAFALHPVTVSFDFNIAATNISANADILYNTGVPSTDIVGNDFEVNLSKLALFFDSDQPDPGVNLVFDEITMYIKDSMVLAAEVAAFSVSRMTSFPTNVSPHIVDILNANFGSNTIFFRTTGVRATTACIPVGQSLKWDSQKLLNTYTMFNISSPVCGQLSRVHAVTVDAVYDAYACIDASTIVTGIIKTNPPNATLDEAMECYTTLWDTLGNGAYLEASNTVVDISPEYESTPMIQKGVLGVLEYTHALWIETMGRAGSPGLLNVIGLTPLDSPKMKLQIEDAVSYLYAIGGAKIIDWSSVKSMLNATSPYLYYNTSMEIQTPALQIGYGSKGFESIWIGVLFLHCLMAFAGAILMGWFPVMPLNPTNPLSMVLLALNSPPTSLLQGASVGKLPRLTVWQRVKGCCWRIVGRSRNAAVDPDPDNQYKNLEFQLEARNNIALEDNSSRYLQLTTYGRRGIYTNAWQTTHTPTRGEKYK